MELHQIRYFLALSKTLNFTRAAESCNVTQPALTRAIQKLEEELGGRLVNRERNQTQLTELGRATLPHLDKILAAAEAAKTHATAMLKQEAASIRLGLHRSVCARTVAAPLAEVSRRIPALEVIVTEASQGELIEKLLDGEIDVAVLVDDGQLPDRINHWPLFREGYEVICAPEHRFAKLAEVSFSDLADEVLVGRQNCEIVDRFSELAAAQGWKPLFRHRCVAENHLQRLAACALGIALVPEHLLVISPLIKRPLSDRPIKRSIVLAAVHGRRMPPPVDAFIRLNRARPFALEAGAA